MTAIHPLMDEILVKLRKGKLPTYSEVKRLTERVCSIFINEPTTVLIESPVVIIGDIHGQYGDLIKIFNTVGCVPDRNYLTLGDYVDRGVTSVETILHLLTLKAMHPTKFHMLRGNHESRELTMTYGFYDEVIAKYNDIRVWRSIQCVFDLLPLTAIVDGRFFCVHGGISPFALSINKIRSINRFEHNAISLDLTWSDPGTAGWTKSQRGLGYLYGADVTATFLEVNRFKALIRSHQLIYEGYKFHFPDRNALTVWSAPDYCGRCGNLSSVLKLESDHRIESGSFVMFGEGRTGESGGMD